LTENAVSHFTRIKTRMVQRDHLVSALRDLGFQPEVGELPARGFAGNRIHVEVRIPSGNPGYDIGFQKTDDGYVVVADWWGITRVKQATFVQQLSQRYAYHATRSRLQEQGFDIVTDEKQPDGRIHLVLRRMA
jgi:hypothetical protein